MIHDQRGESGLAVNAPAVMRAARTRATARPAVMTFAVAIVLYWGALYVYVPVLPLYAQSLGASLAVVGLVVAAYGLGQLLFRLPVGIISDRLARRKPFCVAGMVAASLGSVLMLWAPNPTWLVVGRGVAGISAAAWVTLTIMFAESFAPDQLPRAMAILTFLSGLGQLVSTLSGGWIADRFGWSAPFAVTIGLGVIGAALLIRIPESQKMRSGARDLRTVARVAIQPRLLRVALVGTLLMFASWATTYAFVPIYAQSLGASRTDLGLLTGLALVPYLLAALAVARWARARSAIPIGIGGLLIVGASAAVVPFLHSFVLLIISQGLSGLGQGLTMPVLFSLSVAEVDPAEKATAMGAFQAIYAFGMFLGPAASGLIAGTLGLAPAFLVSGLFCVLDAGLLAHPFVRAETAGVSSERN